MIDQLERCQKALNNFLEEKRQCFARFYFMGDEDLLEVLSGSRCTSVADVVDVTLSSCT